MIQVIGYTEIDGVKTFSDTALKAVYQTLVNEGILGVVFTGDPINSEKEFLYFMKTPSNLFCFIVVDNEIQGFGWLNAIKGVSASAHYAFFKKAWGKETINMARALVDYWFLPEFPFEVLVGQTPEWNRKAVKFLERIGWTIIGIIPHLSNGDGMVISYISRDQYGQKEK